jgi:hypothetical protein
MLKFDMRFSNQQVTKMFFLFNIGRNLRDYTFPNCFFSIFFHYGMKTKPGLQ